MLPADHLAVGYILQRLAPTVLMADQVGHLREDPGEPGTPDHAVTSAAEAGPNARR